MHGRSFPLFALDATSLPQTSKSNPKRKRTFGDDNFFEFQEPAQIGSARLRSNMRCQGTFGEVLCYATRGSLPSHHDKWG